MPKLRQKILWHLIAPYRIKPRRRRNPVIGYLHFVEGTMRIQTRFPGKLCVLFVFTACFAWGQATNSAEVTGSVTDPSGAIVPGVTVTVRDLDKNTERTFTTNDS